MTSQCNGRHSTLGARGRVRRHAARVPGLPRVPAGAAAARAAAAAAHEQALAIAFTWPAVRRAPVTVLGPRCSFRPVLGQDAAGRWLLRPEALEDDANAVDRLVRFALARLAQA